MQISDSLKRSIIYGLPLAALLIYIWLKPTDQHSDSPLDAPKDLDSNDTPQIYDYKNYPIIAESAKDHRVDRQADGSVHYKPALSTSRQLLQDPATPEADLELIDQLFAHYRYAYQENPVGVDNFEITEQLLGNNRMQIHFIASDSPALRGNELVDLWGTPYHFHAVSGEQMDIRSAGPDKQFWTDDDLELTAN